MCILALYHLNVFIITVEELKMNEEKYDIGESEGKGYMEERKNWSGERRTGK